MSELVITLVNRVPLTFWCFSRVVVVAVQLEYLDLLSTTSSMTPFSSKDLVRRCTCPKNVLYSFSYSVYSFQWSMW